MSHMRIAVFSQTKAHASQSLTSFFQADSFTLFQLNEYDVIPTERCPEGCASALSDELASSIYAFITVDGFLCSRDDFSWALGNEKEAKEYFRVVFENYFAYAEKESIQMVIFNCHI